MWSSAFPSERARWNAIKRKDALADGVFIYAVRTTKIYCRPVCKARLARRANVVFYDTPDEAERASYRPCKRCKPDQAGRMPEANAVQRVRAMAEQKLPLAVARAGAEGQPAAVRGLAQMARQAGLSKWHFHRVFKEVTNMTPTEYLQQRSGDSPSDPTSSLDGECSESQSYGVTEEVVLTPELGGAAVASTETGLALSPAPPLTELAPEYLTTTSPALDNMDINLDDFLTNLDAELFENLSRIPNEYAPTVPDPWTLASLQVGPTSDVTPNIWDEGWGRDVVSGCAPMEGYTDWL